MPAGSFYPPVSFYFSVNFSGIGTTSDVAFQEASGLNAEIETEEVVCGGENRFKYKLPGTVKFGNLALKRGLIASGSQLFKWCNDTLTNGLNASIATQTITVSLLDENSDTLVSWDFLNAYPVKWNVSEFKSMENSYAIESLEFSFNYFKRNT